MSKMRATQPCARRVLASGDCTLVEQCSCGHVHLTIGAITMRLDPSVLPSLAETMQTAASNIAFPHVCTHLDELLS